MIQKRKALGFTEHKIMNWNELPDLPDNIILPESSYTPFWVHKTSSRIGDWRAQIRDVYLKWAITINAMCEAEENWKNKQNNKELRIKTIRTNEIGLTINAIVAEWDKETTSKKYNIATPTIAAHGFIDLFTLMEEIIFEWHTILISEDPLILLRGKEYRNERKLFYNREKDAQSHENWAVAWDSRIKKWRTKRGYDGIQKVFKDYFVKSKLKQPSHYTTTNINDWAKTIECIAAIRNSLIHGQTTVDERLHRLGQECVGNIFEFDQGEYLNIKLLHLMYFEMFLDQILTTLNMSLFELHEANIP